MGREEQKQEEKDNLEQESMVWIRHILKEASSDQKNLVRRWRTKDQVADFNGIRKYSEYGRYVSILSLVREAREVTIA